MVREPRAVLQEFGTEIDPAREVRVWDSSAEIRYLVLPQMPSAWAQQPEEELKQRITRNSTIGVEELA